MSTVWFDFIYTFHYKCQAAHTVVPPMTGFFKIENCTILILAGLYKEKLHSFC